MGITTLPGALTDEELRATPVETLDREPEPETVATLVTDSGDTTLVTPSPGQAIRLKWVYAVDARSDVSPVISVRFGSNPPLYTAYAISKKQRFAGAVDEALIVNLDVAGQVAVTVFYEEFTP